MPANKYKIISVKASLRMLNKARDHGWKVVWTGEGRLGLLKYRKVRV